MLYRRIQVTILHYEDDISGRNSVPDVLRLAFIIDIFNESKYFYPREVFQFNNFNDVGIYTICSSYAKLSFSNKIV